MHDQTSAAGITVDLHRRTFSPLTYSFDAIEGGRGAYVTNLWDAASPLTRINAQASGDFATARFMESYESRHSNQSFTAAVAQVAGVTQAPLRMDSQVKYGAPRSLEPHLCVRPGVSGTDNVVLQSVVAAWLLRMDNALE